MEMEKLYTTAEASQYLKVTVMTIRRYIRAGKIKTQMIGKQHRITEASMQAFLDAQGKSKKEQVDE